MSAWITNLPLRHKFLLLCCLALLMSALPASYVLHQASESLGALQAEQAGLPPSRQLLMLTKLLQEHRGLSVAMLSGDASKAKDVLERRTKADQTLALVLKSINDLHFEALSKNAASVETTWRALSDDVAHRTMTGQSSVQRHGALIEQTLLLLEEVTVTSGLSLDADAESYFLIESLFRDVPRLTEKIGMTRAYGTRLLIQKSSSPDDRQAMAALLSAAKMHAGDAERNMNRSKNAATEHDTTLPPMIRTAQAALDKGVALGETLTKSETLPDISAVDYFKGMTEVISAQLALSDVGLSRLDHLFEARLAAERRHLVFISGGVVSMLILGAWLAVTITRTILHSVAEANRAADALIKGDLSQHLKSDSRDEIGQMVNALGNAIQRLQSTITEIKVSSDSVATASNQIAQGNHDLSARTENQAASLQQTASSMDQILATVKQNTDTALQANQIATEASREAANGGEVFSQVVAKMTDIKQTSTKIADINAVIDGIAFQTNILALNAAVEAARAGEQGRGFAVVAAEVRMLAQRSTQAAREIKSLIGSSAAVVQEGYDLASHSSQSIEKLIGQVKKVSQLMQHIAMSSEQQSQGITQVNQSVNELDHTTQQNAALVEESAAAAASLNDQAQRLRQTVSAFKVA